MKLHYSQTLHLWWYRHLRFTTLWNYTILKPGTLCWHSCKVLLPYEITLFSNSDTPVFTVKAFYYLMKLHYSQTDAITRPLLLLFYYLMKLHYSQTLWWPRLVWLLFYYLMKLHYSQTSNKLCHYNAQGNSQDIVYIIALIIITVNNTQIRVQNMYLFKFWNVPRLWRWQNQNVNMTETQGFINTLKLIIIKEIIQAMKNKQIKFKIFIKKNYIRNKKLRQIVRRGINIKLKKL